MKTKSKTLVFFGSGPVAAKSLDFIAKHFSIETVFTKSNGKDEKAKNPVISIAQKHNLKICFADNKKELLKLFKSWQPKSTLGLVIDYGIIFKKVILNSFKYGIINSHFSLLPQWRGADPITYALLSGQSKTGVCLMQVDSCLDAGAIISSKQVDITNSDDNSSLTVKLIKTSNNLLRSKLLDCLEGNFTSLKQSLDKKPLTYSRKIVKLDGHIDWNKPATVLEREIRAFFSWPGSFTAIGNIEIIVKAASAITKKLNIGQVCIENKDKIIVGCRVGSLQLQKIQPRGKKTMTSKDFLNGYYKSV